MWIPKWIRTGQYTDGLLTVDENQVRYWSDASENAMLLLNVGISKISFATSMYCSLAISTNLHKNKIKLKTKRTTNSWADVGARSA